MSNTQTAPVERVAVDVGGLREMLGSPSLSLTSIWRLEKLGKIKRVEGFRRRLYTVASVKAFAEGKA
jgi:hypothetical protein